SCDHAGHEDNTVKGSHISENLVFHFMPFVLNNYRHKSNLYLNSVIYRTQSIIIDYKLSARLLMLSPYAIKA
ncbi:MAG: hypothetical protein ACTMIA_15550, partial [Vibrio sp.]